MRIRGQRECKDCGTRWSYYDTGSVDCPNCGSVRSVGVDDERKRHTDSPAALDLTPVRERYDVDPLYDVTEDAKSRCREYVRRRGFIRGGDLLDLDDTYLAANELVHVADVVGRSFAPTDEEQLYLLSLLRGTDAGERPPPGEVPGSMRAARGLAYAEAVRDYRREVRDWLSDNGRDDRARELPDVRRALAGIDARVKRLRALGGDEDPHDVERVLEATRELADALRDGDETALSAAVERIDRLE
jgi:uncharacterized Zn finger protein (UPF0148 family)